MAYLIVVALLALIDKCVPQLDLPPIPPSVQPKVQFNSYSERNHTPAQSGNEEDRSMRYGPPYDDAAVDVVERERSLNRSARYRDEGLDGRFDQYDRDYYNRNRERYEGRDEERNRYDDRLERPIGFNGHGYPDRDNGDRYNDRDQNLDRNPDRYNDRDRYPDRYNDRDRNPDRYNDGDRNPDKYNDHNRNPDRYNDRDRNPDRYNERDRYPYRPNPDRERYPDRYNPDRPNYPNKYNGDRDPYYVNERDRNNQPYGPYSYNDRDRYNDPNYYYNIENDPKYKAEIENLKRTLHDIDRKSSLECSQNVAAQWNFETNVNEVTHLDAVSDHARKCLAWEFFKVISL